MGTYRQTIDRISNTFKSLNKDDRISKRYILKVFQDKLEYLLSQKLRDRSLFREDGVYTSIPCYEFKKQDVYKCDVVEFRSCNRVMKSVNKLPNIINSRYGPAIREVSNIDGTIEYKRSTVSQYRRDKQREEKDTTQKYYVVDGYLYLPDTHIEVANLYVLTLETYKIDQISSCSQNKCKSWWDYEIPTSDKITEVAVQETLKELGINRQIVEDENPNLDSNLKSKTIA